MKTLGLVMAKSSSKRLSNKNIRPICGTPLLAYPINILRNAGVCNKIVVSTDSKAYKDIALQHGADDVVMRQSWWADQNRSMESFNFEVQQSVEKYESESGEKFDTVAYIGGNVVFLRPSWIRIAVKLINGYHYNDMPIDLVSCDLYLVCVSVYKIRPIASVQNHFHLYHRGIICDIDYAEEFELTRQIMEGVQAGYIDYPEIEHIHDAHLQNRGMEPKLWGGLKEIVE